MYTFLTLPTMIFEVFSALECSLSLKIKFYNYFEIFSDQVLNSLRAHQI